MTILPSKPAASLARVCLASGILLFILAEAPARGDDWPQFRGRGARGVADNQHLPDAWNAKDGTNIRWKTPIPGLGHACPVVSRGRVFIVTADNGDRAPELKLGLYGDIDSVEDDKPHEWAVYCLSLRTGRVLWKRVLHRGVPAVKRHTKASHANITPATDGQSLVVFLGSEGLYCLNFHGAVLWQKNLGVLDSGYFRVPTAQWGFASSPIIHNDSVIVQCDIQKNSFLAAFSLRDGQKLWRTPRDEVPTWSTPTIVEGPQRTEIVVNGYKHAGGYDPDDGRPLWKLSGGGDIPVPTPIFAHDLIFMSSAHGAKRPLWAIRPGALGDVSPPATDEAAEEPLAWYQPRSGIYMQTPIVYGDYLYACRLNGVLSCHDARTGKRLYQKRVGSGGFTASPVAADGKLYFTNEDGVVSIVAAGPEFRIVSTNKMGAPCMATPAIADGMLIIRTTKEVYAIGRPPAHDTASKKRFACRLRPAFVFRRQQWDVRTPLRRWRSWMRGAAPR